MSTPRIRINPKLFNRPAEDKELTATEQGYLRDAQRAMSHPAYADPAHPQHKEAVEIAENNLVAAYGSPDEIAALLKKRGVGV